jgi:hypothetical protein
MSNVYSDILEYLFAKYKNSPNILGVFEILSSPLQDSNDAIDWILNNLSIDEAEGELLDFLGGWIGVVRPPAQEEDIFWLCRDEEVADDIDNHHGLSTDATTEGGYLTGDDGCLSKAYPGTYVSDEIFRQYIRAKASTFRKIATREIMFNYILQFGIRSKLIESNRSVTIEPFSYDDMNYFLRNYITEKGFRPAGIEIAIEPQENPDSEV